MGINRPIRVLLADDQTMFRESLAEVLTRWAGMEVVGQTSACRSECLALVRETNPDVVVMEVEGRLEEAKQILLGLHAASSPPKVAIVTMSGELRTINGLLELGVNAYLLKSSSVEQLIGAIRAATLAPSRGSVFLTLPQGALERMEEPPEVPLSKREVEILLLAARGLSNRQMAASLHISESTVKRHLVNVYAKMDVGSRTEATNKALSEGWLTVDDLTRG